MVKMRLWRLGIAATLAVLLSILAGFLGCGNQPAAGYPITATLAPPPTATPLPPPTATPTPAPTPTLFSPHSVPGNDLPCEIGHYWESRYYFFLHWTPDGSRLIFNQGSQILTLSSDDARMGHLEAIDRFWDDQYADISPDGSQLLYASCTPHPDPNPYTYEAWDLSSEISIIDVAGPPKWRNLTTTKDQYERLPVWSPKGDRIAYVRDDYITWARNLMVTGNNRSHTDLRARTIFHSPGSDNEGLELYPPVWSPDGGRIAFITSTLFEGDLEKPRYFLNVIAADGSGHEKISTTMSVAAWSPDGERIALIRRDGDDTALFTIAPDGSEPRRIARIGEWDGYPSRYPGSSESPELFDVVAWSPDGGRLLYSCRGLCLADVDGGEVIRQWDFNADTPNTIRAAWSPDGSRIAIYAPESEGKFWESSSIHIMASDGADVRRIEWVRGSDR